MSVTEIVNRSLDIAEMERAMNDARRAITLAEVDLIFAAHGDSERMEQAKCRFKLATEILNKWSQ